MNEEEIKKILDDPKKLLDLLRIFHQLLHIYEAREMAKEKIKPGAIENMGLSDELSIQLNNQEVK